MPACSPKSKYKNDQMYECNDATGRYKLKKGYKKVKDPNAPKRPINAYMLFSNQQRESVKASNPGIKPKDVMSRLGAMWREMSDAQKGPYKQQAEGGKAQYKTASQGYTKPAMQIAKVEKKPRAKTGYNLYVAQTYKTIAAQHPEWHVKDAAGKTTAFANISKVISDQWKSLPADQKANFNAMAKTAPQSAVTY